MKFDSLLAIFTLKFKKNRISSKAFVDHNPEPRQFTNDELGVIVTALNSISSIFSNQKTQNILEKIEGIIPKAHADLFYSNTQQFIFDFTPWESKPELENKIHRLKEAIEALHTVSFEYCSIKKEIGARVVEPHTLIFKEHNWYLYAFCQERNGFRLFKLSRIKNLSVNRNTFTRKNINPKDFSWNMNRNTQPNIKLVLRFKPQVNYLAEDWFEAENLRQEKDGGYRAEIFCLENEGLYGIILGFGNGVEVIEPEHVRLKIKKIAAGIQDLY